MSIINAALTVHHLPTGGFKVKIWGQPKGHFSDWNGGNYRLVTVVGQPHRGFPTFVEAETWTRKRFRTQQEVDDYAYQLRGIGQSLKDAVIVRCKDIDLRKHT